MRNGKAVSLVPVEMTLLTKREREREREIILTYNNFILKWKKWCVAKLKILPYQNQSSDSTFWIILLFCTQAYIDSHYLLSRGVRSSEVSSIVRPLAASCISNLLSHYSQPPTPYSDHFLQPIRQLTILWNCLTQSHFSACCYDIPSAYFIFLSIFGV